MHAKLAAGHERVHKLILVREIASSHRLDKMHLFRLLEKLAAWRRSNDFDKREVLTENQHIIHGRVCSVDDPEHSKIDMF